MAGTVISQAEYFFLRLVSSSVVLIIAYSHACIIYESLCLRISDAEMCLPGKERQNSVTNSIFPPNSQAHVHLLRYVCIILLAVVSGYRRLFRSRGNTCKMLKCIHERCSYRWSSFHVIKLRINASCKIGPFYWTGLASLRNPQIS